jgi:predicted DNA-binding transcriptional regulator AlpA
MSETTKSKRLNTKQAASYLGLAEQSLHNRRHQRLLPNYIKIGRRILYDTNDLDAFLESNRVNLMHKEPL